MQKFVRRAFFFSIGLLLTKPYGRRALFEIAKRSILPKLTRPSPLLKPQKTELVLRRYMLYFILPLWFAPGILDYFMHRRTDIERNSGTKESIIHSLMMAEIGVPIMLSLVLEVNAGLLLLAALFFLAHEATAFWDVAYATGRREVRPNEQHIHSFLEVLPFCALSFLICLHSDQVLSLIGVGLHKPDLALRLKREGLPLSYLISISAAILLFIALPYGEELLRCRRYAQEARHLPVSPRVSA